MVVHPATSHQAGTLVNALLAPLRRLARGIGGERRPGIVHRLDKDTSGVLVVAKDEPTLVALQAQFHAHDLERIYLALVEGVVAERGAFKTMYGRDPRDRKKFSSEVRVGQARGHPLARGRAAAGRDARRGVARDRAHAPDPRALLAITGIRSWAIAPTGGRRASRSCARSPRRSGGRRCTRTCSGFMHPATGKKMRWSTPPPADMQAALAALRQRRARL